MNQNKEKKVLKFAKFFSIILIIWGSFNAIAFVLMTILYLFYQESLYAADLTNVETIDMLFSLGPEAIYGLVGGIGLLKLKKWAFYFVCGFGVLTFFMAILYVLIEFNIYNIGIGDILFGVASVYLIRNREYFLK